MLVSLNAIKKYVDIKIPTDELVELIGSRLVEVEGAVDLAPKYDNIYIVKVVECEPIPETHLHLCQIDAGESFVLDRSEATAEKERRSPVTTGRADACPEKTFSASDLIQVVCGAPNVHKGMLAAWIAPGAIVPETYGNENFKISTRKLRGYESNGMLAAADELDLGSDHEGIIEINPKDAKPGDKFADVFDLNDIILDIENKSLTHRPDTFGLIGFAREVAGILGQKFNEPDIFANHSSVNFSLSKGQDLTIEISDHELCPRYSCAVVNVADLPEKTKYFTKDAAFLAKAGMRSIDPIVDLTNILMLETGQPLHAFDYDKFVAVGGSKTPKIIVRSAKKDEELQLLDGRTIKCSENDILITSNNVPVALAGAMGGANTEIDASTKQIILESATFSLYNLRKTQMAHGIFSEAITRFTKGQPASLTMPVLSEAVRRLGVKPVLIADEYPTKISPNVVKITQSEINSLLGTNYDTKLIKTTLEHVGFEIEIKSSESQRGGRCRALAAEPREDGREDRGDEDDLMSIKTPLWRTDIAIKEDIIEEIGRLLGYDNIALDFPKRPFIGAEPNPSFALKTELRNILSDQLAANEVLTYSFISKKLLEQVGQNVDDSYEIINSISPELQCFRQSLVPSLIDKIRENIKSGHKDFTLYELNQVSQKSVGLTAEKTPVTTNHLGLATLGDYYKVKNIFERLFRELNIGIKIQKFTDKSAPYFEPAHAVNIYIDDQLIGSAGEIRQTVLTKFKLDQPVSGLELNLDLLESAERTENHNLSLSKFPFVERDITFKTPNETPFADMINLIKETLNDQGLIFKVDSTSIYQAKETDATKNLSFHLQFASASRTLQSDEISAIMDKVTKNVETTFGAEVV